MNLLYVFLFVVMLNQGYAAKPNVEHSCDPLAMNTSRYSTNRVGPDAGNQVFPIRAFLHDKEPHYSIARATPNLETTLEDLPNSTPRYCHIPFHSKSCGPLRHRQKFLEEYEHDRKNGLNGIKLHFSFIGMSLENGRATQYEMDVEGTNDDDYIFQWIKGSTIHAYEIDDNGGKNEIPIIPDDVLQSLQSEFAIHAIGLDSPPPEDDEDGEDDEDRDRISDVDFSDTEKGESSGAKNEDEENYEGIARLFAIYITCDGKSIWASYYKFLVDEDREADAAIEMDRLIYQLQETVKELKILGNEYPNVKPVSTYMPNRFEAAFLNPEPITVA